MLILDFYPQVIVYSYLKIHIFITSKVCKKEHRETQLFPSTFIFCIVQKFGYLDDCTMFRAQSSFILIC